MIDDSILSNLRSAFASAIQRIYVPSLGKTYSFREPTVKEHKTLSKTIISNKDRQSMVYGATLAMIKNLCIEEDFNPYAMSELDRLRLIVHLFSNVFFSKNLSLKCPRAACGENIKYPVKYGTILKMLDGIDDSDVVFESSTPMGDVKVVSNFPSTMRYLSLLEAVDAEKDVKQYGNGTSQSQYDLMDKSFETEDGAAANASVEDQIAERIRKRREILKGNVKKAVEEHKDVMGNVDFKSAISGNVMMDMVDVYMKRIQIAKIPGTDNEFDIDLTGFGYEDTEKIMSTLPMALMVGPDGTNVVKHLGKVVFEKMKSCVPLIKCPKCGYELSKNLSLHNFFIFG